MVIEDSCAIIPELFVKCLLPKETFEIIMLFNSSDREKTNVDITKHLLICEERVFSDSLIGDAELCEKSKFVSCWLPLSLCRHEFEHIPGIY